jgi:hypothetical protein
METKLCVDCRYHFLGNHPPHYGHWCHIPSNPPDNINLVNGAIKYNSARCEVQRNDLDRCGKDGRWWKEKTQKQKRSQYIDNNVGKITLTVIFLGLAIITFIIALFLPAGTK